jgi:hypothetical protein
MKGGRKWPTAIAAATTVAVIVGVVAEQHEVPNVGQPWNSSEWPVFYVQGFIVTDRRSTRRRRQSLLLQVKKGAWRNPPTSCRSCWPTFRRCAVCWRRRPQTTPAESGGKTRPLALIRFHVREPPPSFPFIPEQMEKLCVSPIVNRQLSDDDVENLLNLYELDRLGVIDRILAKFDSAQEFDKGDLPGEITPLKIIEQVV